MARRAKAAQEQEPKSFQRYFQIDRSKIDETKRRIPFAFSSELGVERMDWRTGRKYTEILDHAPGSIDLSRLNNSHPFLFEHDRSDQLGMVEPPTLTDKILRGFVEMGETEHAKEIFREIQAGRRPHVSVSYDRTGVISKEPHPTEKEHDIIRFSWMPYEVSSVSIPADPTVGHGRNSESLTEQNPQHQNRMSTPATTETAAPDRATIIKDFQAEEKKRTKEIRAAADVQAKAFPSGAESFRALADKAIDDGTEARDFNGILCAAIPGAVKITKTTADIGMSEGDKKKYSLLRAIQCVCEGRQVDGFEKEISDAARAKGQKDGCSYSGNFAVPTDITVDVGRAAIGSMIQRALASGQRDLNVTTASQGGNFVATQLITPIIEILRNRVVLNRLGIQTMSGLSGNIAIPRQTGAATAYSVSESAQLTISTQAINQVSMSPKRVGAYNQYTKQLLLQSSVDVENFIRDDLMKVVAIKLDYLGLQGSGAASAPTGILNTSGVGTITFGAAATFAKMVAMETALAVANADAGRMAYITTPAARGVLKSAAKLLVGATTVTAVPIWDGSMGDGSTDGVVNGFRAAATNQVDNNLAFFGNWEELILGMWGGFDVVVNPYSLDREAEVRITVNTFIDYAVRHAVSFCVSTDNANQ